MTDMATFKEFLNQELNYLLAISLDGDCPHLGVCENWNDGLIGCSCSSCFSFWPHKPFPLTKSQKRHLIVSSPMGEHRHHGDA